jgi:hypothetical protein
MAQFAQSLAKRFPTPGSDGFRMGFENADPSNSCGLAECRRNRG